MMNKVMHLCSLFHRLRSKNNIPLRQPLLDFAFGGYLDENYIYLNEDHRRLLAEDINIYNQGYDFADRDYYYGLDVVKPEEDGWVFEEEKGLWVGLNIDIPEWLIEIRKEREEKRKEAIERKKKGLPYLK